MNAGFQIIVQGFVFIHLLTILFQRSAVYKRGHVLIWKCLGDSLSACWKRLCHKRPFNMFRL